jgi:hypothetical protein
MSPDLFNAEQEALRSLMEWLEQAKKCQTLYERAHMALPEPLKRVLGMERNGDKPSGSHIAAPEKPPMPPEAEPDWIWINQTDATATSVVLAVLRGAKGPLRAKDVAERVTAILPGASYGTVANVGSRLNEKQIRRTEDGWLLLTPESAGVIYQSKFWGSPAVFDKFELAAHRRDAILHILRFFRTGLQTVQILGELQKCNSWVRAPINKDLLKEDMEVLQEKGKVRRRGNSKKWEVVVTQEPL